MESPHLGLYAKHCQCEFKKKNPLYSHMPHSFWLIFQQSLFFFCTLKFCLMLVSFSSLQLTFIFHYFCVIIQRCMALWDRQCLIPIQITEKYMWRCTFHGETMARLSTLQWLTGLLKKTSMGDVVYNLWNLEFKLGFWYLNFTVFISPLLCWTVKLWHKI